MTAAPNSHNAPPDPPDAPPKPATPVPSRLKTGQPTTLLQDRGWKHGKKYAVLAAPLYQLPNRTSQIYLQAISRDVCILSFAHIALFVAFGNSAGKSAAQKGLLAVLQSITRLNPTKDSVAYWRAVNDTMLGRGKKMSELWRIEREATVEALAASKKEALQFLASERERIMRLSHAEALQQLVEVHKLASRQKQIEKIADTGLLGLLGS